MSMDDVWEAGTIWILMPAPSGEVVPPLFIPAGVLAGSSSPAVTRLFASSKFAITWAPVSFASSDTSLM